MSSGFRPKPKRQLLLLCWRMRPGTGGHPMYLRPPGRSAPRCWARFLIPNMPVYIAMLRGINIGPHKRMKMEKLRASCESLGFEQVKTYVQSGNVVFKATKQPPASLSKKLEDRIVRDFGFSAPVIIRTAEEMGKVIKDNPLLKEKGTDVEKLHVTFF